jgi:hypothetical protein
MSEQNAQDTAEQLFDSDFPEAATDAADDTDEEEETSDGEQEQHEPLNFEGKTSAEEQRQKQIDVWQNRIDTGEATLATLPPNLKWMAAHLKSSKAVDTPAGDVDVEAIVERKLAAKEEEGKFLTLKGQLQESKLSDVQRQSVQAEFQDLLESGLSKGKALEKAIKIAGVDVDYSQVEAKRSSMALPKDSTFQAKHKDGDPLPGSPEWDRLSGDKRVELLEARRKASFRGGRY